MMSELSRVRSRPGPKKSARNAALMALRRLGLSPTELTRLDLSDVDREGQTLRLSGEPPEWLPLPGDVLELLNAWRSHRGDEAGPLFTSMRKGGASFTTAGMALILPRIAGEEVEIRADARKPVAERRALRNFEAGVGIRELTSMRIEDLREDGVEVGGTLIGLMESTLAELREWRKQLNRATGPVFVALRGSARRMTEAGIRLILKNTGKLRPATVSPLDRSLPAVLSLWRRLPVELRRRSPQGREVAEVVRWVREACACGAVLEEALRIGGVSPEQYRRACEEADLSEALEAIGRGDGEAMRRFLNQELMNYQLPDLGIDPNGGQGYAK